MCFSARYLPAVLLTLLSLAPTLCAQSTTKQAAKVPRGSVSGRVTIKDKGVPGVVIGLRKGDVPSPREPFLKATTDHDGFYRIANLAADSYLITASAPAFVSTETRGTQFKSVLVGEDENVEGINFSLVRGGVITGRVTDADGRPAIEQQVNVYSADGFDRQSPDRAIFSMGTAQTDDRGIYRIFGLSPGSYKVAAGRSDDASIVTFNQERTFYRQVFHPNVAEHAKATTIEVTEGSEANNVDITLGRTLQTFSASGVVVDTETGQPVPNLRVSFQRRIGQRTEFVNSMSSTNNRGEFVVEGLIPGKYGPYLLPSQSGDLRAEQFSFDVVDQDVSGITIRLTKGASLAGMVVLESEDKTLFAKLSELQLRALVMTNSAGGTFGSSATSPIAPDGSFRLAGLPGGHVTLSLGMLANPLPPKGFTITRIERDGVVLAAPRFEVKEGEQVTGVRVIVSYGTATVRGVVKFENGSLPEGARIFIRLMKAGDPLPMNARSVLVDSRGHFLIEGITGGTFSLVATIAGGTPARPPSTVTQQVNLQEGAVTDVTVTFDMSVPMKPVPNN